MQEMLKLYIYIYIYIYIYKVTNILVSLSYAIKFIEKIDAFFYFISLLNSIY